MLHLVGLTRHSIVYVCPKGLSMCETKFQGLPTRLGYTPTNAEKSWPSNVTYIYKNQYVCVCVCVCVYTGCNRRNGPDFGRVFLMLNYTEKLQNTYIQSWTVWEIMASEVWNFDSCYTLTD